MVWIISRINQNKIFFTILFVVTVLYLSGCNRDVSYEELALSDAPEQVTMGLHELPSGSTGMAEIGNDAYAIIVGEVGQEIEVVTVSGDFDVHYRITEALDKKSERPIKVVKFENNGAPVGFKKVN